MWLFASDWPHGDSAWPESVQQTADRPRLTESARKKILGENAMRLCRWGHCHGKAVDQLVAHIGPVVPTQELLERHMPDRRLGHSNLRA